MSEPKGKIKNGGILMKKLFAFLLAALTAASVTATAFAQEAAPSATLQVGSADG